MDKEPRPGEAQQFIDRELVLLEAIMAREDDLVSDTLRFHLVVESQLDRIIAALLPRGGRLVEKRYLSFRQKLAVVEAFAGEDAAVFTSLSGLNAVRNECAHDRDKVVGVHDLDRIGSPLGGEYSALRSEHGGKLGTLAATLFAAIFGNLCAWVYRAEHRDSA
jgi:hypothetical protein